MTLAKRLVLCTLLGAALPVLALAQSTNPASVGATPLGPNVDVWPEMLTLDNGFGNYDVDAIGKDAQTQREEFVFFGVSNDAQCGPKKAVISGTGVEFAVRDGLVDDNGADFLGAAAIANYGVVNGFGWRAMADGDASSGQFIVAMIFFNNETGAVIDFPGNPVAAFDYCESSIEANLVDDHYLSQRFTRDCAKVSNISPGRNIPSSTSHVQDPWYPSDAHESRAAGCAILSNGNSLHAINDRSRQGGGEADKGAVEYFVDNGLVPSLNNGTSHRVNVHTVTSPDAATFVVNTTPTFVDPNTGGTFENSQPQMAAAGNGWFAMRSSSAGGVVAFFRNDGTRIKQIYGYPTLYQDTPGLLPGNDDIVVTDGGNSISAGGDMLYVSTKYSANGSEVHRPCVLRFKVNAGLTDVTLLPAIIADDDFSAASTDNIHHDTMDVAANPVGDFVIAWRRGEGDLGGPVVARVYNVDGTPATGSFYVSSLADPTTDLCQNMPLDDRQVKAGFNGDAVCVSWFTANGVASVDAPDCSGATKSTSITGAAISTAARVFQVNVTSNIKNWDLY